MNIAVIKFLNRNASKTLTLMNTNFARMYSTDDSSCTKQQQPCPQAPKEPCPSKAESRPPPPPPPPPKSTCPDPPPCPSMPHCPSTICPPVLDSNDPCNYIPPPCPDAKNPDLSRLKKLQCLFQEENGIPIYLKKGKTDAFIVHTTYLLIIIGLIQSIYYISKTMNI